MNQIRLLILLLLVAATSASLAHNRSESFSEWTWRGDRVDYAFSVLQREVTRIPPGTQAALDRALVDHLKGHIAVSVGTEECTVVREAQSFPSRGGYLYVEASFRCPSASAPTATVNTFFDLVATHTHYAKVRHKGEVEEFLLTQDRRSHTFVSPGSPTSEARHGWPVFSQYVDIGFRHILSGLDHLAFLCGLILLATGWREMVWLVTGFTLGHSISLAIAVLGVAEPNSLMVESLIGFTIALVAAEAACKRSSDLARSGLWLLAICAAATLSVLWSKPWTVAAGTLGAGLFALCYLRVAAARPRRSAIRLLVTSTFGVIHGFGFAGGLLEIEFPAAELAFVLLGFNLGVELGQLAVLALVLAAIFIASRLVHQATLRIASNVSISALSAMGAYWFISRLIV